MSEFIAFAEIAIIPNTRGFRTALKAELEAATAKPVSVKVTPNTKNFAKQMKAELKALKLKPVDVLVVPDTKGFKKKLKAAVDAAARGVTVPVGVAPVPGAARGGAAPKGPAPLLSASGKRLTGAAAEAKQEALDRQKADAAVTEARRKAEIKAHAENLKRIKTEEAAALAAIEKERAARAAAAQAQIKAGLVSKTGAPLFGAAAEAKAAALEREKAEAAATASIQKKETAAWAQNVKLDKQRAALDEKNRLKVLADLQAAGLLSKTGKPLTGAAKDAKLEALAREQANADAIKEMQADEVKAHRANLTRDRQRFIAQRNEAVAAVKATQAAEAQRHLATGAAQRSRRTLTEAQDFVPTEGATATARARKSLSVASEAVNTAERAFTATIGTNDRALQIHAANTLRDARALEVLRAETLATTAATDKQTAASLKSRSFATRGFGSQLATFAGLRGAVLSANGAFIAGTIAAITFGKAVQTATQFQTELNTFAAISGATATEMVRVSEAAKQLGADLTLPGVSAVDAAQGIAQLSKAGLDVTNSLGGIRGVLQLATAAQIDNAKATELTASALNAFGLEGNEAVHVADALANASVAAQGSIEDMGIALQQSATVARQVGLNIDQTVAVLTLFARAGLRGSDAGTSFRTMMLRLVNPTAKAQAIIDDLQLTIRDKFGKLNLNFFDEFAQKTANLTKRQREQKLAIITGQDAIRGATILMREGSAALAAMVENTQKQGTASDIAAARTSGMAGAMENLKNQLATTGAALGEILIPGLTDIADVTAQAVAGIGKAITALADLKKQAEKPIDIVVNVIRKITGGEDSEEGEPPKKDIGGLLGGIVDVRRSGLDIGKDFFQLGIELNAQLEEGLGVDTVRFPTLDQARQQIRDLFKELNKEGGPVQLNLTVLALIEMQKQMAKGTFGTKEFAKSLGPVIKELQDMDSIDLDPIPFPKVLLPGAPDFDAGAKEAARITKESFGQELRAGLLPTMRELGTAAMKSMAEGMEDPGAKGAIAAALQATFRAAGRQAGLEEEADILEIVGASPARRRANLQQQAAQQQAIIDESNIIGAKGDALKRRRDARRKLKGITADIRAIDEEIANDAKKAADDAKKSRDEADKNLLASFAPRDRALERASVLAERSPQLTDDIKVARARKQELLRQIGVIRRDFHDRKAAAAEIFARRQEILDIENQIAEDTKNARDQITQTLAKRIQLAELQGGKGAILKAIDNAIKDAKDRVKNWKKLGLVLLDEQILLAGLIKQRKEFLKDLTGGESPDVFAARLFREAVDQFNRFGSNISTGGAGILSPQDARGQFASILTGNGKNVTNLTETTAQRTRDRALEEEKKQTGYLRIIAGGPRTKFVRGAPIPPEAAKTAREIGGNVLKGL